MKKFVFVLLLFPQFLFGGSTAGIRIMLTHNKEDFKNFDKIVFTINGHVLQATDTLVHDYPLNETGFDHVEAVIGNDTLEFFTRFRNKENYTIRPGCCCAAFTLTADKNPARGSIRFTNKTSEDIFAIVAETNLDMIRAQSTSDYLFASESAMCLFKPASVLVTKPGYTDVKYNYDPGHEKNYDSLWAERDKLVLASVHYHFLHGEKITALYTGHDKYIRLKLDGYLKPEKKRKSKAN